jgi:hypothetical protein
VIHRILLPLLAAACAIGTAACGPDYKETDITGIVKGASGNDINYNHVTVLEGTVLKAHIASVNSKGDTMGNAMRTDDPSVMDVAYIISDHDWAFLGIKAGTTKITIQANEQTVLIIDANVVAQPDAPSPVNP